MTRWRTLDADEWWSWVLRHVDDIGPEGGEESAFDILSAGLSERESAFTVEPRLYDGVMHILFSAEGDRERFGELERLVASAPVLPRIRFEAFYPAEGFVELEVPSETDSPLRRLDPRKLFFVPLLYPDIPTAIGLRVFGVGVQRTELTSALLWWGVMRWIGERQMGEIFNVEGGGEVVPAHALPMTELTTFLANRKV